jgi:hypothetical protein
VRRSLRRRRATFLGKPASALVDGLIERKGVMDLIQPEHVTWKLASFMARGDRIGSDRLAAAPDA